MVGDHRGRTRTVGTGAVIAILVISLVVPVAAAQPAASEDAETMPLVGGTDLDPDSVLMAVSLRGDGSARWRVEYRIRLDDENVTRAFESLKTDIERDPTSFSGPFADRMRSTAAAAENVTGREMAITNVSVTAERRQLPQEYGVVAYRFEWDGFAVVDGNRLRAGDAVSGLFLDRETTLLVSWPDGYRTVEVSPPPDERRDGAVAWTGRLDFAVGEPRVVVSSAAPTPTEGVGSPAAGTESAAGAGDGQRDEGGGGFGAGLAILVVIALAAGGVGWWFLRRRPASSGPPESAAGPGREPDDEPPEALLSNEERVLSLLEDRGGRMKQQEVAQALDWTDAKTSQVVGALRESGEIESFRLGRENVLSLPEEANTGGAPDDGES